MLPGPFTPDPSESPLNHIMLYRSCLASCGHPSFTCGRFLSALDVKLKSLRTKAKENHHD